jgi:hypothetical protein
VATPTQDDYLKVAFGIDLPGVLAGTAPSGNAAAPANTAGTAPQPAAGMPAQAANAGDGSTGQSATGSDVCARILQKIKAKAKLDDEISELAGMDMPALLEALARLKKAGVMEDVAEYGSRFSNRFGIAFLTVQQDFSDKWQELYPKISEDDQEVILQHVPDDLKQEVTQGGKQQPAAKPEGNVGWQKQAGAGLQYAAHWTIRKVEKVTKIAKNNPPYDVTMQVQVGANYAGHKENASGPEFQALIQYGYNLTTGQLTVLGGAQGALVQSFANGLLQLQEFVQAAGGAAQDFKSVSGTFQLQIGIQLLLQIGPVQIGIQGAGGATFQQGSSVDIPGALLFVIQGTL